MTYGIKGMSPEAALMVDARRERPPAVARFFQWICSSCSGKSSKYRVAPDQIPKPMRNNWVQERFNDLQHQLKAAEEELSRATLRLEFAQANRYRDLQTDTQKNIKIIQKKVDSLYRKIKRETFKNRYVSDD